tara:strand:- start:1534 stop:1839 length:306 start_codon:yes stop_codon:yes gene_type:complete
MESKKLNTTPGYESVILYDSLEAIQEDENKIWNRMIIEFPFLDLTGCYAKDFDYNDVTKQWALPLTEVYADTVIRALGNEKFNTRTEISKEDPDWFPQKPE